MAAVVAHKRNDNYMNVNNSPILLLASWAAACLCAAPVRAEPPTNALPSPPDPLVAKYDLNRNGKIDVDERKEYVKALSLHRRQEVKEFAAQRPVLTPDERRFFQPPKFTPELILQYDTNRDGQLDLDERLKAMNDAAESARQELRRYDKNGDGKLDKEELKAVKQDRSKEKLQAKDSVKEKTSPADQ